MQALFYNCEKLYFQKKNLFLSRLMRARDIPRFKDILDRIPNLCRKIRRKLVSKQWCSFKHD